LFKNRLGEASESFVIQAYSRRQHKPGHDRKIKLSLQNKHSTNPIINNRTNDNRAVAQSDGLGRGSEPYDCWCNHNDRRAGRTAHVEQAVESRLEVNFMHLFLLLGLRGNQPGET
jgi:hypothetical protein